MAPSALRNAGGVPFIVLKGYFVVRERLQPDGDSIHFVSGAPFKARRVDTSVQVRKSGMLRLQSIDASEKKQPLGAFGRDTLLRHLGFDPAKLGLTDTDFTADAGEVRKPGWIATHGDDGNGRALSYLFRKNPGSFKHGEEISGHDLLAVLKKSANYRLTTVGGAFPAFYENTDEEHAALFQAAAESARTAQKGVWAADRTTTGFTPTSDALDADGSLVYPKFFRRVAKWKTAKPSSAAFISWLKKQADGKKLVEGAAPNRIALWRLFEPAGKTKVRVPYDVTRLWFSE